MTAQTKVRNWRSRGAWSRVEEILALGGGHGPIVVLAGTIDAGEGFLVEQAGQAVFSAMRFMASMVSIW